MLQQKRTVMSSAGCMFMKLLARLASAMVTALLGTQT